MRTCPAGLHPVLLCEATAGPARHSPGTCCPALLEPGAGRAGRGQQGGEGKRREPGPQAELRAGRRSARTAEPPVLCCRSWHAAEPTGRQLEPRPGDGARSLALCLARGAPEPTAPLDNKTHGHPARQDRQEHSGQLLPGVEGLHGACVPLPQPPPLAGAAGSPRPGRAPNGHPQAGQTPGDTGRVALQVSAPCENERVGNEDIPPRFVSVNGTKSWVLVAALPSAPFTPTLRVFPPG